MISPAGARARVSAALRARPALCFGLLVGVVYVATANYGLVQSVDVQSMALPAWALGRTGAPWLDFLPPATALHLWVVNGAHGHYVSNRFPGLQLLVAPVYGALAGPFSEAPASFLAAVLTACAVGVLFRALRGVVHPAVNVAGCLLLAFGTGTWTVSAAALWTHGPLQLVAALSLLALRHRRLGWVSLLGGVGVLIRPDYALAAAGLGIAWAGRTRLRRLPIFAVGPVVGAVLFLGWQAALYGRLTIQGGYADPYPIGHGLAMLPVNVAGALVSPQRGLLTVSPFLLLCLPRLRAAWRTSWLWEKVAAEAAGWYLLGLLVLTRFSGGSGFVGYRLPLVSLVLAAPLLVRAVQLLRPSWLVVAFTAVPALALHAAAAFALPSDLYDSAVGPWRGWPVLELAIVRPWLYPVAVLLVVLLLLFVRLWWRGVRGDRGLHRPAWLRQVVHADRARAA